jgi:general secretion pathway protein L
VTRCSLRLRRDSATTGSFEWAVLDEGGTVRETGISSLGPPPFAGACRLVIASELVLLERVAAPAAQQRGLSSALRFLVEESAIPEPERLHVVAAPAPAADALCVAVIDRQWLERMLGRLARAGLVAVSACPECLLPELPPRAWTVVWNGDDSFARTGPAEGFALDSTDPGDPPVALRLALEHARGAASVPERIVVRVAPGVALPDCARWSAQLGVTVVPGPEWRWAQAQARPGLEILQGEFAPRAAGQSWTRRLRRSAIIAGMLVLLTTVGIAIDWAVKASERGALQKEMETVYRASFGANAVVVDPPLQMSRALASLRQQAGKPVAGDFLVLLASVADRLLDPQRQKLDSIAFADGTLTVSLRPQDPAQFGALLEELRAKATIRGLAIRVEPVAAAGSSTLRVVATLAPGQ